MDIDAASRELSAQVTEDHQIVGPYQNVDNSCHDRQAFQVVKLVQELGASCGFSHMLGFIDQNGIRLSLDERLLKEETQSCCVGVSFPGGAARVIGPVWSTQADVPGHQWRIQR